MLFLYTSDYCMGSSRINLTVYILRHADLGSRCWQVPKVFFFAFLIRFVRCGSINFYLQEHTCSWRLKRELSVFSVALQVLKLRNMACAVKTTLFLIGIMLTIASVSYLTGARILNLESMPCTAVELIIKVTVCNTSAITVVTCQWHVVIQKCYTCVILFLIHYYS